jgi:glycosyltransferase involved in cell wall biosynthesis
MQFDVVIPTCKRSALLLRTLGSIARASIPPAMSVRVLVVDNDVGDDLTDIRRFASSSSLPVVILSEPNSGKSTALNTALAASSADYLGFVDDDEEIDESWFEVIHRTLASHEWDFVGGRCLGRWVSDCPSWIPSGYSAVLGIVDSGPASRLYDADFPGIMTGGNAIIRRSVLQRLGGFSIELGPRRSCRLLSGEDEDMYLRLVDAGAHGVYAPDLVVHHHIHLDRLRKSYYRQWVFWNGTAKGLLSRRHLQPVPHILGVPRYLYGRALRGLGSLLLSLVRRRPRALDDVLPWWMLVGFLYGRHFHPTRLPKIPRARLNVPGAEGRVAHHSASEHESLVRLARVTHV